MIQNKIIAIILAIITFIILSVLMVSIIFYIYGYSLSSIREHQLYAFFGILVAAVLASVVYGLFNRERESNVAEILYESLGLEIKEEDIRSALRNLERFPPFVINAYVSQNINAVEEFEDQINKYKGALSDDDLMKIKRLIEMPVSDLHNLLEKLYLETELEQFKILADDEAEPFLALNLRELKRVLFKM